MELSTKQWRVHREVSSGNSSGASRDCEPDRFVCCRLPLPLSLYRARSCCLILNCVPPELLLFDRTLVH